MQLEGRERERDLRQPGQSDVDVQSCLCYLGQAGGLTAGDCGPQLSPPVTWSGGAGGAGGLGSCSSPGRRGAGRAGGRGCESCERCETSSRGGPGRSG